MKVIPWKKTLTTCKPWHDLLKRGVKIKKGGIDMGRWTGMVAPYYWSFSNELVAGLSTFNPKIQANRSMEWHSSDQNRFVLWKLETINAAKDSIEVSFILPDDQVWKLKVQLCKEEGSVHYVWGGSVIGTAALKNWQSPDLIWLLSLCLKEEAQSFIEKHKLNITEHLSLNPEEVSRIETADNLPTRIPGARMRVVEKTKVSAGIVMQKLHILDIFPSWRIGRKRFEMFSCRVSNFPDIAYGNSVKTGSFMFQASSNFAEVWPKKPRQSPIYIIRGKCLAEVLIEVRRFVDVRYKVIEKQGRYCTLEVMLSDNDSDALRIFEVLVKYAAAQ